MFIKKLTLLLSYRSFNAQKLRDIFEKSDTKNIFEKSTKHFNQKRITP